MSWRTYFIRSEEAVKLEATLKPNLKEHPGGMKSTANTDVFNKIINLDISQPALKSALSYAYELKNLENATKYEEINNRAKKRLITKSRYVKSILELEAAAIFFKCQVFRDLDSKDKDSDLPFRKGYLDIYDATKDLSMKETIKQISLYLQENGIVRREYSVKKYYSDCYDYYSEKKPWPVFYNEPPNRKHIILHPDNPEDTSVHGRESKKRKSSSMDTANIPDAIKEPYHDENKQLLINRPLKLVFPESKEPVNYGAIGFLLNAIKQNNHPGVILKNIICLKTVVEAFSDEELILMLKKETQPIAELLSAKAVTSRLPEALCRKLRDITEKMLLNEQDTFSFKK